MPPTSTRSPVAAEQGMEVHLVTDGISSSRLADRAIALQVWPVVQSQLAAELQILSDASDSSLSVCLQRMQQAGALLTTSEMCMFQLMGGAKVGQAAPAGTSRPSGPPSLMWLCHGLQHPAFKGVSALAKEQRPTQLPALHSNL